MSASVKEVDYRYYPYYDVDQVIVDAERCLECQQRAPGTGAWSDEGRGLGAGAVCVNQCVLGIDIPKALAAIAHRAFVVREGVREELAETDAAAYARDAVNESFSCQ